MKCTYTYTWNCYQTERHSNENTCFEVQVIYLESSRVLQIMNEKSLGEWWEWMVKRKNIWERWENRKHFGSTCTFGERLVTEVLRQGWLLWVEKWMQQLIQNTKTEEKAALDTKNLNKKIRKSGLCVKIMSECTCWSEDWRKVCGSSGISWKHYIA